MFENMKDKNPVCAEGYTVLHFIAIAHPGQIEKFKMIIESVEDKNPAAGFVKVTPQAIGQNKASLFLNSFKQMWVRNSLISTNFMRNRSAEACTFAVKEGCGTPRMFGGGNSSSPPMLDS